MDLHPPARNVQVSWFLRKDVRPVRPVVTVSAHKYKETEHTGLRDRRWPKLEEMKNVHVAAVENINIAVHEILRYRNASLQLRSR